MIRFETILDKVSRSRPDADLDLLRRAYLFSAKEHRGQVRKSGEPYLVHPLEVANILADMQLDVSCVTTGLLHDIVEDTNVSIDTIEQYFGGEIAHLVDGLTKIAKIDSLSRADQQAANIRKMLLAMVDDIRVVLVKLADRLHNMRTLEFLPRDKQVRIAQETLDVYAPIAHRLGMSRVRGELEDLAFKYIEPDEYLRLQGVLAERKTRLDADLDRLQHEMSDIMRQSGVHVNRIEGRIKRPYSIHQKLKRQKISIEQVYDLVAIRIIVDDIRDCYAALGSIHTHWRPVPGRFKDWIAIPRENMYQSLHTTVVGTSGHPFEVQIRTLDMHGIAEEGIAAHWKYKEGKLGDQSEDAAFQWLKRLVEWQQEVSDSRDFMDSLKLDLYPKEVYTFTPKGKVIELPRGATPVDFAYAIHTEVGHTCVGAKVNGRIVPLKYQLRNGEVVEIMTNAQSHPSRDWLNNVMTSKARSKVRHYLAESERERSIDIGKKLFEKEAERFRLSPKKLLQSGELQKLAPDYGLARSEDIFAAIGYGKVQPRSLIAKLLPPDRLAELEEEKRPTIKQTIKKALGLEDRIQVKGIDDIMVYRARCCNPVRGEDIIGFITRGKGVAVHSAGCPNVPSLTFNKERLIPVEWVKADSDPGRYIVSLRVTTEDRPGMLADLTLAIANLSTNLRNARASVDEDAHGRIELTVEVFDLKHLERLTTTLRSVADVLGVERVA
ncbi:MAG: bifunctional (p)ppGpp synthetase/guanosine-3',5'-bis(diphosphate) 3'-pyrophosphohydrolase [Blastocatellia bacterium]|jgi:GTP pyrophosphokinase|nr:bifunctional (p)ppGpp synthetase/guanosine-3',5'-bis(diphosphate) 3'-pyrophosphohydrolase [Blastocatellia bacterium]MBK6426071.1 bifunctional (p)ppGpp synthetase/guanosine-3',5'-bis(diphosphate) 3'-pyrophosphohydrolase [Blastocatellia bacterium]